MKKRFPTKIIAITLLFAIFPIQASSVKRSKQRSSDVTTLIKNLPNDCWYEVFTFLTQEKSPHVLLKITLANKELQEVVETYVTNHSSSPFSICLTKKSLENKDDVYKFFEKNNHKIILKESPDLRKDIRSQNIRYYKTSFDFLDNVLALSKDKVVSIVLADIYVFKTELPKLKSLTCAEKEIPNVSTKELRFIRKKLKEEKEHKKQKMLNSIKTNLKSLKTFNSPFAPKQGKSNLKLKLQTDSPIDLK